MSTLTFLAALTLGTALYGQIATVDLARAVDLSSSQWSQRLLVDRVSQQSVKIAGVAGDNGKGYLAIICVPGNRLELRASAGQYIGRPRVARPFVMERSSTTWEFAAESRADFFLWSGKSAEDIVSRLLEGSAITGHFFLWDNRQVSINYSLQGAVAAIHLLRSGCL